MDKRSQKEGNVNANESTVIMQDSTLTGDTALPTNQQSTVENPQKPSKIDMPLLSFCLVNFLLNAAVSIITPFYPPLAEEAGLSVGQISYVFSINPVGTFFFSLVMGSKMNAWGRKRCMIIGLMIQVITIVGFGLLELVQDNYTVFFTLSLVTRFMQGASRACYASISFAYVPILWPTTIQQKISIMESLTGLGLMSGPFLGAFLDHILGYQWLFYTMGALFALSIIPTFFFLPDDNREVKKGSAFNPALALGSRHVILLALVVTMTSAGTCFLSPMFSIHMKTYGISKDTSSLLLGAMTFVYIISINFVPPLTKVLDRTIIMTLGVILSALGDLVIAPLQGLPNEWWMVLIGLPLIGIANALCVLPSIPQFIIFISKVFQDPDHRAAITDLSSGLFVGAYSFGVLIGPMIGGQTYQFFLTDEHSDSNQQYAFRWASIVVAGMQFVLALIFFFCADAYKHLCKSAKKKVEEPLLTPVSVNPPSKTVSASVYNDDCSRKQSSD